MINWVFTYLQNYSVVEMDYFTKVTYYYSFVDDQQLIPRTVLFIKKVSNKIMRFISMVTIKTLKVTMHV